MDWNRLKIEYETGNSEVVVRLLRAVIYESRFKQCKLTHYGGSV